MITYGMGAKSLASKLECSVKEAEDIIEYFYEGFPGVKKLTEDSQKMLKEKGYVVDMWTCAISHGHFPKWIWHETKRMLKCIYVISQE